MFASTTLRSRVNTDMPERVPIYKCYNRTKGSNFCKNATAFKADRIDGAIKELLHGIFEKTGKSIEKKLVDTRMGMEISTLELQLKKNRKLQREHAEELDSLEARIMESLSGKGVFTPEQLKSRMDKVQAELVSLTRASAELEGQLGDAEALAKSIVREAKNLKKWAEIFDDATPEVQKMIVAQMVERVTVKREYEVDIKMNISMEQFMGGL